MMDSGVVAGDLSVQPWKMLWLSHCDGEMICGRHLLLV